MEEITVGKYVDAYFAYTETLQSGSKTVVEEHRAMALGYLWGRMDAGESLPPLLADAFSWAYGSMHALNQTGVTVTTRPLRDSWESFRESGEIRDYNGKRLDALTPVQADA